MFSRHDKRTVPQLNTTSTADISFILLVFFLIMTSMDSDKGLARMLPPMENVQRQGVVEIEKSDVLSIQITSAGHVNADGKPVGISQLRQKIASFIGQPGNNHDKVIMLETDRKAPYNSYFDVQNEISAAYNVARDRYAVRTYGHAYGQCTPAQREDARAHYPQRIIETATGTDAEGGGR